MPIPWMLQPGMSGDPRLIRIGPGAVGDEEHVCAAFGALKARPAVSPARRPYRPGPPLQDFTLQPTTSVLDAVEFEQTSLHAALVGMRRAGPPVHPGLARYTEVAAANYLACRKAENRELVPVRDYWVARGGDGTVWELYAWGRRYQSLDRRMREFTFLRFGLVPKRCDRDPVQIAIAAYSAAFGATAPWPKPWHEPFKVAESTAVDYVRVTEVGLADGTSHICFEGTPAQARSYYATYGREQVRRIAAGGPAHVGSSCAQCKAVTACAELPKAPGLLGLDAARSALRKISVTDLRYHRDCPAQAHLRSLNLPKDDEYGPAAVRGQAVHSHLATNHSNPLRVSCKPPDVAVNYEGWSAGRWHVHGEQAPIGAAMLAHHVDVCPLASPLGVAEVRVEPMLAYYDTAVDTIVIARPDLLYREGGSWVWRETKSTEKDRWYHDDLLDEFPQLALGVLILARSLLGGDPAGSRVELETLRPYTGDVEWIDPNDPARVAKARDVLRSLAAPWHRDRTFNARPGRACHTCPVTRWCPSYVDNGSQEGDDDD